MKEIKGSDYMHVKRICKDFELKHLYEHSDLYLKSDTFFWWMFFN